MIFVDKIFSVDKTVFALRRSSREGRVVEGKGLSGSMIRGLVRGGMGLGLGFRPG